MDAGDFDRWTRLVSAASTRRGALGAMLAALVVHASTEAKRRRRVHRGADLSGQSTCNEPGHGTDLDGCDFSGANFVAADLSSSSMRATVFRGANLCGADLSSSQLRNADFRSANLTRADLSSSGCAGIRVNANTVFCQTVTCNGTVRNDGCPAGVEPDDICCVDADCSGGRACSNGRCSVCPVGMVELPNGSCAIPCDFAEQDCPLRCFCSPEISSRENFFCTKGSSSQLCFDSSEECPPGFVCSSFRCLPLC